MEWKKAVAKDNGDIEIPERWLHLYYYEALNILFRFENSLRVFVYVVLKREFGEKWIQSALSSGGTINSETRKRVKQSRDFGYLGHEVSSPMLFLNSGELIDIIISDAYWKYFSRYFKTTKAIVSTKLQEIGTVRNSLAHFRPIKEDDIDLIKQNTKHVLLEVERCLSQLTSLSTVVPTNSENDWYKLIKTIGSENIDISLFTASNSQEWVRVCLGYKIPTLVKQKYSEESYGYSVGKLRPIEIIRNYPGIKGNCIYLSETEVSGALSKDFDIASKKNVSLVFSADRLNEKLDDIVESFKQIVLKIDEETDLLQKDNLARGSFLETERGYASVASRKDGSRYWNINLYNMDTPLTEISEVEFWGKRWNYEYDFVSATPQYPWMPSTISKDEIPF